MKLNETRGNIGKVPSREQNRSCPGMNLAALPQTAREVTRGKATRFPESQLEASSLPPSFCFGESVGKAGGGDGGQDGSSGADPVREGG